MLNVLHVSTSFVDLYHHVDCNNNVLNWIRWQFKFKTSFKLWVHTLMFSTSHVMLIYITMWIAWPMFKSYDICFNNLNSKQALNSEFFHTLICSSFETNCRSSLSPSSKTHDAAHPDNTTLFYFDVVFLISLVITVALYVHQVPVLFETSPSIRILNSWRNVQRFFHYNSWQFIIHFQTGRSWYYSTYLNSSHSQYLLNLFVKNEFLLWFESTKSTAWKTYGFVDSSRNESWNP